MFKAGSTFRDKNKIRLMHKRGMSADLISQTIRVKPEHVEAVIKQVDAGTLKRSARGTRSSGGEYSEGAG